MNNNNKVNQPYDNRAISVRIANIKFSIFHRTNKRVSRDDIHKTQTQIQTQFQQKPKQKVILTRNCFIPSTNIKSQSQMERSRKINHIPLFPVDTTYSKFPIRRPKSTNIKNYFPVYRERIVTFTDKRRLNLSQTSHTSQKIPKNLIIKSRASTKSCLVLNQPEKQPQSFVRYSNFNIKHQARMSTQRQQNKSTIEADKFAF